MYISAEQALFPELLPRPRRYIIIGDTAVGKSCLLLRFSDSRCIRRIFSCRLSSVAAMRVSEKPHSSAT